MFLSAAALIAVALPVLFGVLEAAASRAESRAALPERIAYRGDAIPASRQKPPVATAVAVSKPASSKKACSKSAHISNPAVIARTASGRKR
jgi:hypothetical protein